MKNGEKVVAEIPIGHIVMYEKHKTIGKILKLGATCECCGRKATRFFVLKDPTDKDGNRNMFRLYTEDLVQLTIDHINPKSAGGRNAMSNYQVLCKDCNSFKGAACLTVKELQDSIVKLADYIQEERE